MTAAFWVEGKPQSSSLPHSEDFDVEGGGDASEGEVGAETFEEGAVSKIEEGEEKEEVEAKGEEGSSSKVSFLAPHPSVL